ncbi:hypothetical protein HPP92_018007 [Vanilla planifolia]|uniref:Uncharacterized protein n=1 Tax=Vanilla planifolia TaxID=51239 RepID=A0A835QBZ9_VANPL|nr:hypothetical protein HPP92_018007 [Vanilla planifolia]
MIQQKLSAFYINLAACRRRMQRCKQGFQWARGFAFLASWLFFCSWLASMPQMQRRVQVTGFVVEVIKICLYFDYLNWVSWVFLFEVSLEPRRLEEGAARELHGMKVLSCFGPTSCVVGSAVQGKTGEGRPAEENRKMVVESDDYPSSGANNRHDPTEP